MASKKMMVEDQSLNQEDCPLSRPELSFSDSQQREQCERHFAFAEFFSSHTDVKVVETSVGGWSLECGPHGDLQRIHLRDHSQNIPHLALDLFERIRVSSYQISNGDEKLKFFFF